MTTQNNDRSQSNCKNVSISSYGAAQGSKYVGKVQEEVNKLTTDLNSFQNNGKSAKILGGDLAEFWHADTLNLEAALKQQDLGAITPRVNSLGSADIQLKSGEKIQLKYYADAKKSTNAQRTTYLGHYKQQHGGSIKGFDNWLKQVAPNASPNETIYSGEMIRLIPTDQLQEAKVYLSKKIINYPPDSAQFQAAQETLKQLTDRIEKENVSSKPLTKSTSNQIAAAGKQGKFDPKKYGLDTKSLFQKYQKNVVEHSLKTGVSAASMAVILELLPDLIKTMQQLASAQGIDFHELSDHAGIVVDGATDAFLQASLTDYLTSNAVALLGPKLAKETVKNITPMSMASIVVLTYGTCKNYIQYSRGKLSAVETKEKTNELLFQTVFSFSGGLLGSIFGPVVMTLGSILGSTIGGFIYQGLNSLALSFAVKSGSTIFGLVEQDYSLTPRMMKAMGLQALEMESLSFTKLESSSLEFENISFESFTPVSNDPNYIRTGMLRRGVIGINKIGYLDE